MNNETTNETAEARKREVLVRFTQAELDIMRRDTGADADASAVRGYCRKRMIESGAVA